MAPKQTEKILVVDDDAEVVELIAGQVLAPLGYAVATASDGATALQLLLKLKPDILITALELPGLSGRDLLTAMRSQDIATIVIATGPRGAETHALQAFRLGARDYLSKPVREAELVAAVDRCLAEARLQRERQKVSESLASANRQLLQRVEQLTNLAGISKVLGDLTNVSQIFARLLEASLFVTEADLGWLALADEASGKLILRAGKHLPSTGSLRLNQPWDDGIAALLNMKGEGLTLTGSALAKLRAGTIVKAAVAVPIKVQDKTMGVLVTGNKTGRPFNEQHLAMLSAVADHAALALVNMSVLQDAQARAQGLQQAQDELAKSAARKAEGLHEFAAELQTQLAEVRTSLELFARSGGMTSAQADSFTTTLSRLAAAQRSVAAMVGDQPDAVAADTPARR